MVLLVVFESSIVKIQLKLWRSFPFYNLRTVPFMLLEGSVQISEGSNDNVEHILFGSNSDGFV